jgi:hypothetical protein
MRRSIPPGGRYAYGHADVLGGRMDGAAGV